MPPRKKTEAEAVKPPRPKHLSELCSECGQHDVHPDYAAWSCEHGTWNLADDFDNEAEPVEAEPVSEEDARAAVLASLSDEELQALLEARTAQTTPAE